MMAASIGSSVYHPNGSDDDFVIHEQRYLMSELESLGLSTIQLNEFNNNEELRNLVCGIKQSKSPSSSSKNIVTKKSIEQSIEELRSLGIRIKTAEHKSEIRVGEQELADVLRIVKHSLYRAYKTAYSQKHEHDDDDSYSNRQVTEANTA